jgi:opacity protein-like surface antigen
MRWLIIVAGVMSGVCAAGPAWAQTDSRGYVRASSGATVDKGASEFSGAFGFKAERRLRIGVEIGRMSDVAPQSLKTQFDDPLLKSLGVTVTPRAAAWYGLAGATVVLPIHARVRPYIGGSAGLTRMSARLDVSGSGQIAEMIRHDRSTGTVASTTRPLTALDAGVVVPLAGTVTFNVGYRYVCILDENTRAAGRVQIGLTLGF